MIRSFRHKDLERLHLKDDPRGVPSTMVAKIRVILADLELAERPTDLDRPGYVLHRLKGGRKGLWSVRVTRNWRVIFRFDDEPWDVDLLDYH